VTATRTTGPIRIAAARVRVEGAKRAILVGAVCTFAIAMGLARLTHPGAGSGSQSSSQVGTSESDSATGGRDDFFGQADESEGDWGSSQGGGIGPSTVSPHVRTQSS
jgi:hypothetical protein